MPQLLQPVDAGKNSLDGNVILGCTMTGLCLLFWRSPAAILWGVRPVIVYSIECLTSRARHHIGVKVGCVVPTFADGNAASTIPFITRCLWIVAALHHAAPNPFQWSIVKAVTGHRFTVIAATGSGFPASQRLTKNNSFGAAVTAAEPSCSSIFRRRGLRQNGPTGEALSSEVNEHVKTI